MVDALERKRRKWHGKQTKKGIQKAKVQKAAVKKAVAGKVRLAFFTP